MDWDDYELECYVSFLFSFSIFDTFGPVKRNVTYLQPELKPKCHDSVHDHNQNISEQKKKSQIDPKNVPDLTGFYVFYSLNVLHLLPIMQNRIF